MPKAGANGSAVLLNAIGEDDNDDFRLGLHVFQSRELFNHKLDDVSQLVSGLGRIDCLLEIPKRDVALDSGVSLEAGSEYTICSREWREAKRIERFAFRVESR